MPSPTPTFIFAGGGSGGHIYPGLAIAEQLLLLSPGAQPALHFIISDRPLDAQILGKTQHNFTRSPARPLSLRPRGLLRFLANWGSSIRQCRAVIRAQSHNAPVHLVAMGGFVAAPAVQAARVEHIPITLVNLDAVPGKANRWMSRRVDRIFTAARLAPHHANPAWAEVPPIVRAASRLDIDAPAARRRLNLDPARPVLMITGGSQGIRTINNFALALVKSDSAARLLKLHRWQILHQTGKNEDAAAANAYRAAGIDAIVQPFVDHMGLWYAAADLALCTAGAGNVAEIWANHVPAILMPYPYHKDQHQKFNALALEHCGGAIIARDHIDPALNLQHIGPTLESLLADAPKRHAMRTALQTLGPADGASRIAHALLESR